MFPTKIVEEVPPPKPIPSTPETLFVQWYERIHGYPPSNSLTNDLAVKKAWLGGFQIALQAVKNKEETKE